MEKRLTFAKSGHILTNANVWSPDGEAIIYDVRSDPAGAVFDGNRIEIALIHSSESATLFESRNGANCGVASFSPAEPKAAFILGPESPTPDWSYAANHRQGVLIDVTRSPLLTAVNIDARQITPPFKAGALRGGSHVHIFSPDGAWVSFTYQDHVLAQFTEETPEREIDLRNVGLSVPIGPVTVSKDHSRNHDGAFFSVLVTRTKANPLPGSDEIRKACEEGWIGAGGYRKKNGEWQNRALAFQGEVLTERGQAISEVFIVDLPDDVTQPSSDGPLEGTATTRPRPPLGAAQRRLTFTADRSFPGLQGPRHWLRSSPDGSRIAFLMRDKAGIVQLWTISPCGGEPEQVTQNPFDVASAFTWSGDGRYVAHVMDRSVCLTDMTEGKTRRITPPSDQAEAPRPEACVLSPDDSKIAYVRSIAEFGGRFNQIFIAETNG